MGNVEHKYQKNKYCALVFLLAFIPRAICTFFMVPVTVLMDELCTLNGAACFAGLNWDHVVGAGSYYGIGFYALLFFIFKLTDNPFIIYHFILLVLALLQSVTALICFHLLTEKFDIQDYLWGAIAAVTCSYMVVSRVVFITNEHPLILITWIAVWLILLLCECRDNKRKVTYTFFLLLLLSYSLLIHTRAITYWIAFVILVVVYGLVYRKCLISIPVSVVVTAVAVPIGKSLIKNYQSDIWNSSTTVTNTTIDVSVPAFNLDSIRGMTAIVLGEINTIGVYTGGISYIAIITCTYFLFQCLKQREKVETDNHKIFAIIVFCGVCVAVTIAGMFSSSWRSGIILGIQNGITSDFYPYKGLTYIRYFAPYLGPLLLITLLFARKYRKEICKIAFVAIIIMLPVQLYWLGNIIPLIARNSTTNSAFMLFALWNENKELGSYIYYLGIKYMLFISFLYERLVYHKRELASVILVCVILLAQHSYTVFAKDLPWAEKNLVQADAGYEWVKELENKIKLPNKIYVQDNKSTSHHKSYYMYQFMLNRYVIMPGEPDESIDEAILFENTAENVELLRTRGFEYKQLDENEYVFVKGESLKMQLKNVGIVFEK